MQFPAAQYDLGFLAGTEPRAGRCRGKGLVPKRVRNSVPGQFPIRQYPGSQPTCDAEGQSVNSVRVADDSPEILRLRSCPPDACKYSPNPKYPEYIHGDRSSGGQLEGRQL